jgi:hypothetical protein
MDHYRDRVSLKVAQTRLHSRSESVDDCETREQKACAQSPTTSVFEPELAGIANQMNTLFHLSVEYFGPSLY